MKSIADESADMEPLSPGLEAMLELRRSIQTPQSQWRDYKGIVASLILLGFCAALSAYSDAKWMVQFYLFLGLLVMNSQPYSVAEKRNQRRWELVLKILTERNSKAP